jgi:5'-nucleotidase
VLGINELCGGIPELVVSGINRGANVADDVNYSGTVAAAVEAVVAGIPAIAASLAASWPAVDPVHHWETAAGVVCDVAAGMLREPLPAGTYWNVNVPNVAPAQLAGVRFTRQGRKHYTDRIAREGADDGATFYWVWGNPQIGGGDDTDSAAVAAGYASITPLRIDRTDEALLQRFLTRNVPA